MLRCKLFSIVNARFVLYSQPSSSNPSIKLCRVPVCKYSSSKDSEGNKKDDISEPKIDLEELKNEIDSDGKQPIEIKDFSDLRLMKERELRDRYRFGWKHASAILSVVGLTSGLIWFLRRQKTELDEQNRKKMVGKALIGGKWELVDTEGKVGGSETLKGNWLLMYFGFTHCPDICPDELEKMVEAVELLGSDKRKPIQVIPVFISIDPTRDTIERVKDYCLEFSAKMKGFTGTMEQVAKVAKTFRVYYSQGPSTPNAPDDYIVDHTVIKYLIDPDGNFDDYYGQNSTAKEIANAIRLKSIKRDMIALKSN